MASASRKTPTSSVDCNRAAWRAFARAALQLLSELSWRGFLGRVLVCSALAEIRNRCAVFNKRFPIRSWKRSRTMTVERLRMREPVNNGRRNHRTFSRELLATVLDASAQERSTFFRGRKRNWTAPLVHYRLCCGSLFIGQRVSSHPLSQFETRPLRGRCRHANARLLPEVHPVGPARCDWCFFRRTGDSTGGRATCDRGWEWLAL